MMTVFQQINTKKPRRPNSQQSHYQTKPRENWQVKMEEDCHCIFQIKFFLSYWYILKLF